MKTYPVIFFGSTTDSVIILESLQALEISTHLIHIACIVTQPPRAVGRNKTITPTPVEVWAKDHTIPTVSFSSKASPSWQYENEQAVIDTLQPFRAELLISASYGQMIPSESIRNARRGGINVHPSLLPRWRGADPVPWAILSGDHQTGVSVITLADSFDEGKILAQHKEPILPTDTADPLRSRLFMFGGQLLSRLLRENGDKVPRGNTQSETDSPYARKFSRDDGYIPWDLLKIAMDPSTNPLSPDQWHAIAQQHAHSSLLRDYLKLQPKDDVNKPPGSVLERFFRALIPWPGMWTTLPISDPNNPSRMIDKRVKITACSLTPQSVLSIDTVQVEGKLPVAFAQFSRAYLTEKTNT